MKIKINKKLKIALIVVSIILIGINSLLLYREVNIPKFEEQNNKLLSYNNKGTANYQVFLKPNNLYKENPLGPERIYITEFVDYLSTNFNYEFLGDKEAEVKGKYNIIARVTGFTYEGENFISIWEKDYPIVQDKDFSFNDENKSINEEVNLYLTEYNKFVEETIQATKINCDTSLTLIMQINLTGLTDKGIFEESISPSLVVPLNTSLFKITTNNIDKPGAIEETIQVQLPLDKIKVTLIGIVIGISVLGLIFLLFFTKDAPKKDALEKALNNIFKKHGARLVALTSNVNTSNAKNVVSINDLVRLADEINKPIFYKHSDNYKEINKFLL
ncbi:MAG: DUF5305 family protein [Sedimentibacter sp.]|uniref:DUF5305 family protein n=1 Tax=Sedimentibacter sp. TaxID=1960295 RepID=UPI0029814E2B|nr:DUF5305 family protein [Sedimentibacter sp.]MDW5299932.1 DUF5305 family protein [Sedimentibacter sp.]